MAAHLWRDGMLATGLLLGAAASFFWYGKIAAQDKKPDLTEAKYYGVSTCNKCHADAVDGKPGKFATDFVLMNEFTTWRTKDKHALAYLVLEGPRGRQIGKILNIDVTKEPQCLNCHATTSRTPERSSEAPGVCSTYGTTTTRRTDGSLAAIAATLSSSGMALPLYQ